MATRKPAPPSPPKKPTQLRVMRVVAFHLQTRWVTAAAAKDEVLTAAKRVAEGAPGTDTERLVARLEKVTGLTIAELAALAHAWRG